MKTTDADKGEAKMTNADFDAETKYNQGQPMPSDTRENYRQDRLRTRDTGDILGSRRPTPSFISRFSRRYASAALRRRMAARKQV